MRDRTFKPIPPNGWYSSVIHGKKPVSSPSEPPKHEFVNDDHPEMGADPTRPSPQPETPARTLELGKPCPDCGKVVTAPLSHICQEPKRPKEKHSEGPTPFCWYIVTRDITDEYSTAYSEGEECPGPGWKPLYEAPVSAIQQSDTAKLYHDLLLSVGNRYPGETRHETAKRYILEAERGGLHAGQAYADSAPVSSTASKEGP